MSRRRLARERELERERERDREKKRVREKEGEKESESETQREIQREENRDFVLHNGLVLCMLWATPESSTCLADAPELHGLHLGLRGRMSRSFSGRFSAWSLDPWSPPC
jgi:hypothetical protein